MPDFRNFSGFGNQYLLHSFKGTTWKNHKYVEKVETEGGYTRYIYSTKTQGPSVDKVKAAVPVAKLSKEVKDILKANGALHDEASVKAVVDQILSGKYPSGLKGLSSRMDTIDELVKQYNKIVNPEPIQSIRYIITEEEKKKSVFTKAVEAGKNAINSIVKTSKLMFDSDNTVKNTYTMSGGYEDYQLNIVKGSDFVNSILETSKNVKLNDDADAKKRK